MIGSLHHEWSSSHHDHGRNQGHIHDRDDHGRDGHACGDRDHAHDHAHNRGHIHGRDDHDDQHEHQSSHDKPEEATSIGEIVLGREGVCRAGKRYGSGTTERFNDNLRALSSVVDACG